MLHVFSCFLENMYCSCLVSRAIELWLKKNSVGLEGTLMNERVCPLYPFFISPLQLSLIFMCWCTPHTLRFHPDCHPYPWRKSFRGLQCVQRLIYFHPECKVSCQGKWNLHRIWWREKYLRSRPYLWVYGVEVGEGQEVFLCENQCSLLWKCLSQTGKLTVCSIFLLTCQVTAVC